MTFLRETFYCPRYIKVRYIVPYFILLFCPDRNDACSSGRRLRSQRRRSQRKHGGGGMRRLRRHGRVGILDGQCRVRDGSDANGDHQGVRRGRLSFQGPRRRWPLDARLREPPRSRPGRGTRVPRRPRALRGLLGDQREAVPHQLPIRGVHGHLESPVGTVLAHVQRRRPRFRLDSVGGDLPRRRRRRHGAAVGQGLRLPRGGQRVLPAEKWQGLLAIHLLAATARVEYFGTSQTAPKKVGERKLRKRHLRGEKKFFFISSLGTIYFPTATVDGGRESREGSKRPHDFFCIQVMKQTTINDAATITQTLVPEFSPFMWSTWEVIVECNEKMWQK